MSQADLVEDYVRFSVLDTGEKGVAVGLEDKFLAVQCGRWGWRLKLIYLPLMEALTPTITVKSLDETRFSRKCRILREQLGAENLDKALIEIEENEDEFVTDDPQNPSKKEEETAVSGQSDQGYFELVVDEDFEPKFLTYEKGEFKILDYVTSNTRVYVPRDLNQVPYRPYQYYQSQLPKVEEIYNAVYREFDTYLDLEDAWKHVLASCVLLTYQQDKVQTVPYIYAYGDNESGKTTVLNVMNELCYRPLFGVTIPPADLYGYLEDSNCIPTILEDELQGIHKEIDKIKIYKSGYKRGACVPRTILLEHSRIIKYYNTFCFKAVAGENVPTIKGLVERFIFIPMIQGTPEKEWCDNTVTDQERFRTLRNMLLKWRLTTREEPLPNLELPFKGRAKEIWKPLLQVTYGLKVYQTLFDSVTQQIREREESRQNTLEGKIVKVVGSLYHGKAVLFNDIWGELLNELEGTVDTKKPYVMLTAEFDEVTKSKVGYRLREVLGGIRKTVKINGEPTKVWEFNPDKLARVLKKYGYHELHSMVTELPSYQVPEVYPQKIMLEDQQKKPILGLFSDFSSQNPEKNEVQQAYILETLGNLGNSVTETKNAVFMYRRVQPSEKCPQCGASPVEYEVLVMPEETVLRKCEGCFSNMRRNFSGALWKPLSIEVETEETDR